SSGTVRVPVVVRAETGAEFEGSSEGGGVVVAGEASDLVDGVGRGFEEPFGVLDTRGREGYLWGPASRSNEAPREGSAAETELVREFGDTQRFVEMRVDVCLDLVDGRIVMRAAGQTGDVGQLAGTVSVYEKHLGGEVRACVSSEALEEVDDQREKGGRAA